jgi:hypothetical protein
MIRYAAVVCLPVLIFVNSVCQGAQGEGSPFLLINEISPFMAIESDIHPGPWIELINPSDAGVLLSGWSVSFHSGWSLELPSHVECPPNGLVLITTGVFSRVIDPNASVVVIEGGPEAWLLNQGDGCLLQGPDGPVDAVTWGVDGEPLDMPISCGSPVMPARGFYTTADSIHTPGDVLIRVSASVTDPNSNGIGSEFWQYRSEDAATPGQPNPWPEPVHYYPSDGTEVASDCRFSVDGFEWSTHTTFQFSRDPRFTDVVVEKTTAGHALWLDSLDAGLWHWRVRGYGAYPNEPGPWSQPVQVVREAFDIEQLIAHSKESADEAKILKAMTIPGVELTASHVVPTQQKSQRKDTTMLCLDGCHNIKGRCTWCEDHPEGQNCFHGNSYCTRCSVSMMAAAGGKSLSQDRITYYLFEEAKTLSQAALASKHLNDPYRDLGHTIGTWSEDCPLIVSWIYGQDKSAYQEVFYHDKIFYDDSPEMDSFVEFIMDGRTILRHCASHTNLLTGVATVQVNGVEKYYCQVHDTGGAGNMSWVSLESTKAVFNEFTFPPTTGSIVREDELELSMDSDEDGVSDFDEIHRFKTDPYSDDTDDDGLPDKIDMYGYLFNVANMYQPRNRDMDGDGKPKELDPDNDDPEDKSVFDGCEDSDKDGYYNLLGRETDCFVLADDFQAVNPECFRGTITIRQIYDIDLPMQGFDLFSNIEETIVIGNTPLDSSEYTHDHFWSRLYEVEDTGEYKAEGDSALRGHAMVKLEQDPTTKVYSITTDVDTEAEDFTWDNQFPGVGGGSTGWNPTVFFFKGTDLGNPRYDIEEAFEFEGGLKLQGEIDLYEQAGVASPMSTMTLIWDIWISPPTE